MKLRGRDWILLGICCVTIFIFSKEGVGGPAAPALSPSTSISQSELSEAAPLIAEIKTQMSDANIEVFVVGWRPSTCHKSQEIQVSQDTDSTKIIIRMQKSTPPAGQTCTSPQEPMTIKVADLPKTQKASYKILVLGHKGWHQLDITHLMPPGL